MTLKLLSGVIAGIAIAAFAGILPASAQVACAPAANAPAYQSSTYAPAPAVENQFAGYYGPTGQPAMQVGYYGTSSPLTDLVYGLASAFVTPPQYMQYSQYSGYPYYASYPNYNAGFSNYAGYPGYNGYPNYAGYPSNAYYPYAQRGGYYGTNVRRVIIDRRPRFVGRVDRDDRRNVGPVHTRERIYFPGNRRATENSHSNVHTSSHGRPPHLD